MIVHEVVTTEKVAFTYRVAGIGSRFLAWLVDVGILLVLMFVGLCLGIVIDIGRAGLGGVVILSARFVLMFGYFLLFEWLWNGQTLGKYVVGIRVVTWEGTSMSFMQSAIRNILRAADGLPFPFVLYGLGFAVAICNREQRRLGDLAAGTLVVHAERRARPIQALLETSGDADRAWRVQVRQRLNLLERDQKQTILDLCLRRDQLRLSERARLFRATAQYFQDELGLAPEQYQSDEKFVLALGSEIGALGERRGVSPPVAGQPAG
jgi:uncharacterized RDD family membrane protein YckC